MITPVILCGGAGRRLWPASRRDLPKPFLPLLGPRSLYQETLLRVADPALFAKPVVVAAEPLRFTAADQARTIGRDIELLLEAEPKGSAMAAAAGVAHLRRDDPDAAALILPADQMVADPQAFAAACAAARAGLEAGRLVLLAARPGPEEDASDALRLWPGAPLTGAVPLRAVDRVAPAADSAAADDALCATGALLASPAALDALLERAASGLSAAAAAARDAAAPDLDFLRLAPEPYAAVAPADLDALLVASPESLALVEAEFGWRALEDWRAVWRAAPRDALDNAPLGRAHLAHAERCLVRAAPELSVSVLGLSDVAVIATPDAVLVADLNRAEAVRDLVADLDAAGAAEVREHPQVLRPWGGYESIGRGERYQVKKIWVEPGGALSLQKHFHRSEHWVVVRGAAEVTRDDETVLLRENESVYLPQGCVHRLVNPGKITLELIEVQVGSYLGEDDIIRLEDVYNRAK